MRALRILDVHPDVSDSDDEHSSWSDRAAALAKLEGSLRDAIEDFDAGVAELRLASEPDATKRANAAVSSFTRFVLEFPQSYAGRFNLGLSHLAVVRARSNSPGEVSESLGPLPESDVYIREAASDHAILRKADVQFEEAIKLDLERPLAWAGRAIVATRLGDLDAARKYAGTARILDPEHHELALIAGNVEYRAGRFERALALYDESLSLHQHDAGSVAEPYWPPAQRNRALALEKLGREQLASTAWERLLDDARFGEEARLRIERLERRAGSAATPPAR